MQNQQAQHIKTYSDNTLACYDVIFSLCGASLITTVMIILIVVFTNKNNHNYDSSGSY
tara:strand:- start:328 stop:501 length:174 start_codon:yes stop_codon:yes gene_type:complete